MLSETNKTTARQRAERQGAIMKPTKKGAMEYAKLCINEEKERIVDIYWNKVDRFLRVITIKKETHLVYALVIAYDNINEEYYKLKGCYMFTM